MGTTKALIDCPNTLHSVDEAGEETTVPIKDAKVIDLAWHLKIEMEAGRVNDEDQIREYSTISGLFLYAESRFGPDTSLSVVLEAARIEPRIPGVGYLLDELSIS